MTKLTNFYERKDTGKIGSRNLVVLIIGYIALLFDNVTLELFVKIILYDISLAVCSGIDVLFLYYQVIPAPIRK